MQRTAHMARFGRGLLSVAAFLTPPPAWSKEAKNAEDEEKKDLIALHSRLATLEADNSDFKTLIRRLTQGLKCVDESGQQPTARESQILMTEMDKHYTEAGKRYLELHELTWAVREQQQTNQAWLSLGEFVDVFNAPEQWANLKELYHEVKSALTHLSRVPDQSVHDCKTPWEADERYLPAAPALYRTETTMQKLVLALYAQGSLGVTCNNGVHARSSSLVDTRGALARYEQADKAQDQHQESEWSDRMDRAPRFHKAPESGAQASTGAVDAHATWTEQVLALASLTLGLTTTTPAGVDVKLPETQLEIIAEDGTVFANTASVETVRKYPGKVMMPPTDVSSFPLPEPGNSGALTDKDTSSVSGMSSVEPADGLMARMDAIVNRLVTPFWNSVHGADVVPPFRQNITMAPLISIEDQRSVSREVIKLVKKLKNMYQPIMDPADFIHRFIEEGIKRFESSTKTVTNLNPESKIKITFSHNSRLLMAVSENRDKVLEFSLTEIVTGIYLHEASRALGPGYTDYVLEHSKLINELKKTDLQKQMQDALTEYKKSHEAGSQLKQYYADMINLRCLEYLNHPHAKPEHIQSVEKLQSGELQAQEVEFHDTKLNGVFFIPSGDSSGLLFSVDDPKHFHIGSNSHTFREMGKSKTEVVPTFPESTEFKNWVLAKIPYVYNLKHANETDAFEYKLTPPGAGIGFGWLNQDKIIMRPFSFKSVGNQGSLPDKLFDGFMGRLESDIDTLVFSHTEKITEQMLNAVKGVLNLLVSGSAIAIPGTGTILGRLFVVGTSLLAGGGSAGVSGLQAHLSERPERTEYLLNEAIVGGLLTGLFGFSIGTATGKAVLKEVYSLKNIRQVLDLYRHVKNTVFHLRPRLAGIAASGGPKALSIPTVANFAGQRPPENLMGLQSIKSGGHKPVPRITGESISQHRIRHSKGRLTNRADQRPPENLLNIPMVRLEPLRQIPAGKVGNLAPEMSNLYDLLKQTPTIQDAIDMPAGKCDALLKPVAERIQQADIGMKNIRYRAIVMWSSATERSPTNHFVVVAETGGEKYVFDLSAHQFADRGMPDLSGPLILTEADWAQKYANASSRKLIRYKDFSNADSAVIEFNAIPGVMSPEKGIEGGTLLTDPQWYKTLTNRAPAQALAKIRPADLVRRNPVRDATDLNMRSGSSQGVCWDYAADILREANMLNPTQAKMLANGFKKASNYQGMGHSGRVDNLIFDRSVTSIDELLLVKQGEVVVFMEVDPNMSSLGARPVHVMIGLGDGQFTGMKNDFLDPAMGPGKRTLRADELGDFRNNKFFNIHRSTNAPSLEIKAGYPMVAGISPL